MAFDFHLHIPESSKHGRVIKRIIAEQHVTPEQAAERLLEEAAELHLTPWERNAEGASTNAEFMRQLAERSAKRTEARRIAGDPLASIRPETPDALIGYLADAPEVAQVIRDLAYERRAETYGI